MVPDLIYARDIADNLSPDSTLLLKKGCTLLIIEVDLCGDSGCHDHIQEKTLGYARLLHALHNYGGVVEFVCIPIG